MRLLACFTKRPLLVDLESNRSAPNAPTTPPLITTTPPPHPSVQPSPDAPPPRPSFVPSSIPELHPEYAHAEPYCFVARTDSARVVVDRLRGARGQPALDHAHILREQGVTVVRGPSYSAAAALAITAPAEDTQQPPNQNTSQSQHRDPALTATADVKTESTKSPKGKRGTKQKLNGRSLSQASVPLRVEKPSPLGTELRDSDDDTTDENDNSHNLNVISSDAVPADLNTPKEQPNTVNNCTDGDTRNENEIDTENKDIENVNEKDKDKGTESPFFGRAKAKSDARPALSPKTSRPMSPSRSFRLKKSPGKLRKAKSPVTAPADVGKDVTKVKEIPTISMTDLAVNDAPVGNSAFDKLIEKHMDNTPTELLAPIRVPRTSAMYGETASITSSQRYADADADAAAEDESTKPLDMQALTSAARRPLEQVVDESGLRSRRKSKPFLPPVSTGCDDTSDKGPGPSTLTDEQVRTNTQLNMSMRKEKAPDRAEAPKHMHIKPLDMARAAAAVPTVGAGAGRNAARRKTVSFHDAAPVIIEPNLRAPSQSLPRRVGSTSASAGPPSIGSVLSQVRDSVTGFVPLVDVSDEEDFDDKAVGAHSGDKMNNNNELVRPTADTGNIDRHSERPAFVAFSSTGRQDQRAKLLSSTGRAAADSANVTRRLYEEEEDERGDYDDDTTIDEREHDDNDNGMMMTLDDRDPPHSGSQYTDSDIVSQAPARSHSLHRPQSSLHRERSDMSYGSSLDAGSSVDTWAPRRESRRVSARDKVAIREATRRQSMAVAQAMSQQIRGVPRSAMLAYSENEIVIDDVGEAEEEDGERGEGGTDGMTDDEKGIIIVGGRRRKSTKSIVIPQSRPGQVPPAPPPPPFSPRKMNVRSVRSPPPPPSSPLPH